MPARQLRARGARATWAVAWGQLRARLAAPHERGNAGRRVGWGPARRLVASSNNGSQHEHPPLRGLWRVTVAALSESGPRIFFIVGGAGHDCPARQSTCSENKAVASAHSKPVLVPAGRVPEHPSNVASPPGPQMDNGTGSPRSVSPSCTLHVCGEGHTSSCPRWGEAV